MIYPWQNKAWSDITKLKEKIPHALLLKGNQGIGKLDFSMHLAKSLLCTAPKDDGDFCGSCTSCHWFSLENHPDFRLISPEIEEPSENETASGKKTKAKKKEQISVDQIRQLADFSELSSHQSQGYRIVVIHPAETLSQISASALLKILEEPPANMIFILVAHQTSRLLPTILSRCQQMAMPMPDNASALAWLKSQSVQEAEQLLAYASGSPLLALQYAENGLALQLNILGRLSQGKQLNASECAADLVSGGMDNAIQILQKWMYDLVSLMMTGSVRYYKNHIALLEQQAKETNLALMMSFISKLDQARKLSSHPLNQILQLENLLLQYQQIFLKK